MAEKEEAKKTKRATAKKRDLQNEKRRLLNKSFKSKASTTMRAFVKSLEKAEAAPSALNAVYSIVDKAVKKGIVKQNKADRIKSRAFAKLTKTQA